MGLTLSWLSIIILIPLAGLFLKSLELSPEQFWAILSSRRTLNALRVSFGLAFAAACVNLVMGSDHRLGAGALPLSRAGACSTPSSTCLSRCRPRSPASR